MSVLTFRHHPNVAFVNPGSPGDTAFHQLTLPPEIVALGHLTDIEVAMNCTNSAGNAAGGVMFVSFNTAGSPTTSFPILPNQTFIINSHWTIWYKCATAADIPYFCFMY